LNGASVLVIEVAFVMSSLVLPFSNRRLLQVVANRGGRRLSSAIVQGSSTTLRSSSAFVSGFEELIQRETTSRFLEIAA